MSISAYIEHQRYDSDLTLEILNDEKNHILPFIVLERLSSVIVSLTFTVLLKSRDLFCFERKIKLKLRFRELRIGWPIILSIQWRKYTRHRWNLSIEHCRRVLHLSYWEYQYFCMSWFAFNKKKRLRPSYVQNIFTGPATPFNYPWDTCSWKDREVGKSEVGKSQADIERTGFPTSARTFQLQLELSNFSSNFPTSARTF